MLFNILINITHYTINNIALLIYLIANIDSFIICYNKKIKFKNFELNFNDNFE